MAINLEDHKSYNEELKEYVVPLSIAKKAVEESYLEQLNSVTSTLIKQMGELNPLIDDIESINKTK